MVQMTKNAAPGFGIGAVARMTGLSDHTLRVWERRYKAVVARRSSNGRRIYEAADVEKFKLLKVLTEQGHSIGQIANESTAELQARVDSARRLAAPGAPATIRTALFGDFLRSRFNPSADAIGSLHIVVADNDAQRFEADLQARPVDVLIVEASTVDSSTGGMLRRLLDLSGARRGILVYSFARSEDLVALRNDGVLLLRAPLSTDEIQAATVRAFRESGTAFQAPPAPPVAVKPTGPEDVTEIPARRFSQSQLASLANASSQVDCECPQHLAQLVAQLTAFEIYSAQCASRDNEEVQLHRFLHGQTAAARALVEESLQRVANAEGIDY